MTGRPGMSRSARRARRAEAQRVIRHLGNLVERHRVNDRLGAHVTLWLTRGRRVEWWPGACRWRDPWAGMVEGSAGELVEFLRRQASAQPAAPAGGADG